MPHHCYKKVELVGTSATSISDAINNAIGAAGNMFTNLGWFEVQEIRGHIHEGKVSEYQVIVKVGCKLDT
jgi:flavin-binding protein dodecin